MDTQSETAETKAKTPRKTSTAGVATPTSGKTERKKRTNKDSTELKALKQLAIDLKKKMVDQKKLDKVQAHEKKKLVKILDGIKLLTTAQSLAAVGEAYDDAQSRYVKAHPPSPASQAGPGGGAPDSD